MRYAVISKGLGPSQIEAECLKVGAKNIRTASLMGQVFCELEPEAVPRLKLVPGLQVKEIKDVTGQVIPLPYLEEASQIEPVYAASQGSLASLWWQTREMLTPPITGAGFTVAVLDSGIRKSHRTLRGKVIYEANFTDSPTCDDIYDHGTGVAYLIAGGRHSYGEESGLAPAVSLMNIKVLGDDGVGTTESVILGLEEVCRLRAKAEATPIAPWEPEYPNIVNLSLGAPDDGDWDNPIRVAVRKAASEPYWLGLVAAAGNSGPKPFTIMIPACDPYVYAVGAVTFFPYQVWEHSSRGPTLEGFTKPDVVFYGVNIQTASSKSDEAFAVKSGTSFACALISGMEGIIFETIRRTGGDEPVYSTYAIGLRWIAERTPAFCRKPPGEPLLKDNNYGDGQPFGDLAINELLPSPMADLGSLTASLLGLGVTGAMVRSIVR